MTTVDTRTIFLKIRGFLAGASSQLELLNFTFFFEFFLFSFFDFFFLVNHTQGELKEILFSSKCILSEGGKMVVDVRILAR